MPDSALAIRWRRPQGGFALYVSPATKGGGTRLTGPQPGSVLLGPARLAGTRWEGFEPTAHKQAALIRDLQTVDADEPEALAEFASRWGRFGVSTFGWELSPGALLLNLEGERVEIRGEPIRFEDVRGVQGAIDEYSQAVRALALLPRHSKIEPPLRVLVAHGVNKYVGPVGESLAWIVGSPLALAWQTLREDLLGGVRPLLCKRCSTVFTPKRTDKRRGSSPPDYCSDTCRSNAAHARLASGGKPRPSGRGAKRKAPRSGRGRK